MDLKIPVKPKRYTERPKVMGEYSAPGNGAGELQEPEFDEERFTDYCAALNIDYLVKNFPEPRLRPLCMTLRETLDRCAKRLQQMENQRTALLCSHCQKPLPHGRFAGEIVIRDDITGDLVALRACCEACYREIGRIANERRAKQQGNIRGTIAF